ncbi:MAG: zinc carboxypeptidase [Candidatus Dadabacteria bacterium]|nr:MAG: zinc carboxypeptidase [Candidatus Dadabacteria bacterium]
MHQTTRQPASPVPQEWRRLRQIINDSRRIIRVHSAGPIDCGVEECPIYGVELGAETDVPTFVVVAGIHGLERVGIQVALHFLEAVLARSSWDPSAQALLARSRLVVLPIANPAGLFLGRRGNGDGIDLMRCAPVDARDRPPLLAGGHRLGNALPWYRGKRDAQMPAEARAVTAIFDHLAARSTFLMSIDLHSGFGNRDRIWYPWAHRRDPFPDARHMPSLCNLLDTSLPHHVYRIEPQGDSYTAHGDLWDWLWLHLRTRQGFSAPFLPLTLEMGSWIWVRKNPRQLLSRYGLFNPVVPHRHARVMRRHLPLLEFLWRAASVPERWLRR